MNRTLTVTALIAATALTGCMATNDDEETTNAAVSDDAQSEEGNGYASFALTWEPTSDFSPYSDDATVLTRMGTAETLVSTDDEGVLAPGLAEEFSLTDNTTAEFAIRPGATFHDGTQVTAENVAASIQEALDASVRPEALEGADLRVEVSGDTVRVESATPDPLLLNRFANPGTMILAPQAYAGDTPDPRGFGTGPFVVEAADTTGITAAAFDEYWAGEPKLAGVNVSFMPDGSTRANALRSGDVHMAENVPVAQLGQLSDFEIFKIPEPRLTGVYVNTEKLEAAEREAVRRALKPEQVAEVAFEGTAEPATTTLRGEKWDDLRPDINYPTTSQIPTRAITIGGYNDRPELAPTVSLVADQLREAGFDVADPVVKEYTVMESDILGGTYDLVVGSHRTVGGSLDALSGLQKVFSCDGSFNVSQLCDPEVEESFARGAAATDLDTRDVDIAATEARALSLVPYVPLAHQNLVHAVDPKLSGLANDLYSSRLVTHETSLDA